MIKINCDICGEEMFGNKEWFCEMMVKELKQGIIVGEGGKISSRPEISEDRIQFCKKCYHEKVAPLFEYKNNAKKE